QLTFIFLLLFFITYAQDSRELTTEELLINSTVRLDVTKDSTRSSGTGFIFCFSINQKNVDVIVTNYHVISNAKDLKMQFTEATQNGKPKYGQNVKLSLDENVEWIK